MFRPPAGEDELPKRLHRVAGRALSLAVFTRSDVVKQSLDSTSGSIAWARDHRTCTTVSEPPAMPRVAPRRDTPVSQRIQQMNRSTAATHPRPVRPATPPQSHAGFERYCRTRQPVRRPRQIPPDRTGRRDPDLAPVSAPQPGRQSRADRLGGIKARRRCTGAISAAIHITGRSAWPARFPGLWHERDTFPAWS